MRMLVKVTVPTMSGNKAIQSGELPKVIGNFLERWKPEAAYFGAERGARTGWFFVDVKEASQIPPMFEPFFMGLDAQIEMSPVMSPADLKAGLSALAGG
jgi:hypothetical protein